MSVEVLKLDDGSFTVNGKSVYKDSNDNWVYREELTTAELKEFRLHTKTDNEVISINTPTDKVVKVKNNFFSVKVTVKPINKSYKSKIFQGIALKRTSEEAIKETMKTISEILKEEGLESDIKLLACVKLRADFIVN